MSTSTEPRRFSPLSVGPAADLEERRQAARALGYAEGWSSGRRAAAAQADATQAAIVRDHEQARATARSDVDRALAALSTASGQLAGSAAPLLDEIGDVLLEAAVVLARAVLDAELSTMDDVALAALRRALRPLPTDSRVTVRVNPTDHARLLEVAAPDAGGSSSFDGYDVRLVPDATLRRGDAVADQAGSVVDARIEAGLARAVDAIRSGAWSL
jgi:flagellar assembly protein FliH